MEVTSFNYFKSASALFLDLLIMLYAFLLTYSMEVTYLII